MHDFLAINGERIKKAADEKSGVSFCRPDTKYRAPIKNLADAVGTIETDDIPFVPAIQCDDRRRTELSS